MNTSSGRSGLLFPMGSDTMGAKWRGLNQQFARPFGMGFGLGPTEGRGSKAYGQFQNQLETAQGPMAGFIRQGQSFLPTVQPGMQQVGTEIAGRARPAFEQLMQQIQAGQGVLGAGVTGMEGAMGAAQNLNPYAAQMTTQAFSPEAQQALQYAQQSAQQAFSPIQQQTLYQQALQQGTNAAQQGLAARGLSTGGAGAAAQEGIARQLATDFASQQAQQQLAATQNLAAQQQALQGLQSGALGAQGQLAALQGQLGQGLVGAAPMGAQLAGMGMDALAPLMQNLSAQYGLPMSAMNDLMAFFSGAQQPNYGLLQAAMPSVGTSQSALGILG